MGREGKGKADGIREREGRGEVREGERGGERSERGSWRGTWQWRGRKEGDPVNYFYPI